ncbi:MAG TPA: ArsR family transcriptional regulator [Candidatus Syntrophoarchaeum butanivorans]|uniref:ArsR family transcriptional regulator n=1 Tax=Candidatus Syntropharchaeum butanivorans TaxID=1839936 RepID=A0A1F2P4P1_9EURY|nr:MAG: ArsR transcriptional regulator [Candidatus Syntrophoarchaeum butanivorans]RJS73497.1 MAG: ArsR family transcriptional regulator [Candidatus Syntrophoarchaeum sp. WYZ-LMO15]HDM36617.1 ArsR family transcriptional regulator [Candidatus Syntrophoarchaeum butanivorans]HEC56445.1 ArsR family transcriptional regulator [Candidatus Syntrophoarchaeum butanivorans]
MAKRVRIVNDLPDLVPLLHIFATKRHKEVFDLLSSGWYTEDELKEMLEYEEVKGSIDILRESGLLESKWRPPEAGGTPEVEYTTSYSKVRLNLQCEMEDLGNIISLSFMDEKEFDSIVEELISCIKSGKDSITNISISEDISPIILKAIVKRSPKLLIKGQKLEVVSGD